MDDTPPPEPRVERVDMPDGRYLLYFSWPDEPVATEPPQRATQPEPPGGGADE